jgi:pimeloyl-ACP methyl ester carboxylesterase
VAKLRFVRVALFLAWPGVMLGQQTRVVHPNQQDSLAGSYRIHEPAGKPVGLLVLIPGGPARHDEFGAEGMTPSKLPQQLTVQQMVTIVPSAGGFSHWLEDGFLKHLDTIVAATLRHHRIPTDRVVVGGFSAGGTAAVRYAEFCAARRSAGGVRVRAVFAVDAPLDFGRFWRGETLAVRRVAHPRFVAEAKAVLADMRRVLGGSPEEHPARYIQMSPFSAFARGGGQARLLADMAVRLYTEPDIHWWRTNRLVDYYSMNALDAASLILQLQLLGNRQAELITTQGRGVRPGGERHPHSWSIVDEPDLGAWILRQAKS